MDEPLFLPQPPEPTEPTITLPLSLFLTILWSYKKGTELRERAVPGKEVVALLSAILQGPQYFHIQRNLDGEDTVWQRGEWRNCGERETERNIALRALWAGIELVLDNLQPRFAMFTREQLRTVASDLISGEKWETLEGMGIDCSAYKKPL